MKTNIAYDVPTYPEFGRIYPGDYYADLPFDRYIDRQQPLPRGANVFDIRDFGAVPEKERLNTQAFWAAAKACEEAGGGTILVAGGSYWMGAVSIPSNTTLFIAADSEIVASRNVREMSALAAGIQGNEHGSAAFVLISNADNEEQVAIPQEFDEFLTDYPESNAHGDVDACGLWVRHADGVLLQDIQVTPRSCNTREAVRLYDVR